MSAGHCARASGLRTARLRNAIQLMRANFMGGGIAGSRDSSQALAAVRDFDATFDRFGSGLCENSSARRARRNISEKLRIMESNRAPRTMFDTLLENCIFYISQLYEFSHRLGQKRRGPSARVRSPRPLLL